MVQLLSEADKVNFREIIPPEKFEKWLHDYLFVIGFENPEMLDSTKVFGLNLDNYI